MNPVGGEQEVQPVSYYRCLTNSGRASLRLIIESAGLQGRHFMLPDFLCEVIPDILEEYGITCDYYEAGRDLVCKPVNGKKHDVVYVINYFGRALESEQLDLIEPAATLIIDDVFSPVPQVLKREAPWYSYNSLRKISSLADGSLVCANRPLDTDRIVPVHATPFSEAKYHAKHLKYDFLYKGDGSESAYLLAFRQAEKMLGEQKAIYGISMESQMAMIDFFRRLDAEAEIRERHFNLVMSLLPEVVIRYKAGFYSFAPLLIENRNHIRESLMQDNIFLAVHWPTAREIANKLSDTIISIPLDSRYTESDITRVCTLIKGYLG